MKRTNLHAVRGFITILCFQGVYATIISFFALLHLKDQFLFLLFGSNIFFTGTLWVLLIWGFWGFKTWAYWIVLIIEFILLLQGIFSIWFPQASPLINSEALLALICIFYLVLSKKVRIAFFTKNVSENKDSGVSPHLFE